MDLKICYTCKKQKKYSRYSFQDKKGQKLHGVCRKCHSDYRKNHYRLNRSKYIVKAQRWNRGQKERIRYFLFQYLINHPCIDCGESDIIVLDFDHVRRKKMCISIMLRNSYSIDAIKKEIDQCEVRCSNCHRRRTSRERNDWRIKMGP